MKLILSAFLLTLAVAMSESRVQQHRGLTGTENGGLEVKHPYLFLRSPLGRTGSRIQGFEVIEEEDDDKSANEDDSVEIANDDEDDIGESAQTGSLRSALRDDDLEEDYDEDNVDYDNDNDKDIHDIPSPIVKDDKKDKKEHNSQTHVMQEKDKKKKPTPMATHLQMILQNAKPTHMMVSKEHAGAIMVPDGIIEIEGQSVIDEKTGKAALLVPREALEAIPDGSVVALMERTELSDEEEEERANRVIVTRRRLGSKRTVRRRTNTNRNRTNRRQKVNVVNNGNRNTVRRTGSRRTNVRIIRPNTNNRRRQVNKRRVNRPIVYEI